MPGVQLQKPPVLVVVVWPVSLFTRCALIFALAFASPTCGPMHVCAGFANTAVDADEKIYDVYNVKRV